MVIMRVKLVVEYSPEAKPISKHFILLPNPIENNFYREVRTFNSFFFNIRRRLPRKNGYWYNLKDFSSTNEEVDFHHFCGRIPEYRHLSMFGFYKFIGWNYKKKKYES